MNRKNFFQRFLDRLRPAQKTSSPEKPPSNDKDATAMLLQTLQLTSEVELTCDEVFAVLGEYTEKAMKGEDVASVMPLVKQHLDMCPDCREEYEALERILQSAYVE
jgi:hypothetical protein